MHPGDSLEVGGIHWKKNTMHPGESLEEEHSNTMHPGEALEEEHNALTDRLLICQVKRIAN